MNPAPTARPLAFAAFCLLLAGRAAEAQVVTIQQPVVQQFGTSTIVRVPDQGSLLLGSVATSGAVSRWRGPGLTTLETTRTASRSGAWVHVVIHDFDALDRAVLEAAGESRLPPSHAGNSPFTSMEVHARQNLLMRHSHLAHRRQPGGVMKPRHPTSEPVPQLR